MSGSNNYRGLFQRLGTLNELRLLERLDVLNVQLMCLEPNDCQPFTSSAVHGWKEPRGKFCPDVLLRALQVAKMVFKGKNGFIRFLVQNESMPQKQNTAGPEEINDVAGVG